MAVYEDDFEVEEAVPVSKLGHETVLTEALALNRQLRALGFDAKAERAKVVVSNSTQKSRVARPQPSVPRTLKERDELQRIKRDNLGLLAKLDHIQTKGGVIQTVPKASNPSHIAAAAVNRKKNVREVNTQNLAMLKRLQNVKSSVAGPAPFRLPRPAKPTPTVAVANVKAWKE